MLDGYVAKANDNGHTLFDYFPVFKNNSGMVHELSLVKRLEEHYGDCATPKNCMVMCLDIIVEYLSNRKIKNQENFFTRRTLLTFLKENYPKKREKCRTIILNIHSSYKAKAPIEAHLDDLLIEILSAFNSSMDQLIFSEIVKNHALNNKVKTNSNKYRHESEDAIFDISVSTIHKIKGETHTATLVLETFKNGYDLFQLLDCLKGKKKSGLEDKKKLIYVAMTRATHFLCMAIHQSHTRGKKNNSITDDEVQILKDNGFDIIQL